MNDGHSYYDVCIIGGGLAGLASAIQLGREGFNVILFEKERYPFHKVCGEYMSMESWEFLQSLGIELDSMHLPVMHTLQLSAMDGTMLTHDLPLGGFGISRYMLDNLLMEQARLAKVTICEGEKVNDVQFADDRFLVTSEQVRISARVCCGSFGKRSSIDVKWKRPFVTVKKNSINQFIAVKYHVRLDHPRDKIALHHFPGGYCGIGAIEDDKTNICYLATAASLRAHGHSIRQMEQELLSRNPHLKKAFADSKFLFDKPQTISQISFENKEQVFDHVLLSGDAAGLITPLCGNGMSMALHGSRLLSPLVSAFLLREISRTEMEQRYQQQWIAAFDSRLKTGRFIQQFFNNGLLGTLAVRLLKPFPAVTRKIVAQTHGRPWMGKD